MALKLLVSLAILTLALSVPYPDSDNTIHINVQQIVNAGGCCPEPRPCDPKDCTYMGKPGICGKEAQPPFIKEVGAEECCDECKCYIEGCVFGDTTYPHGDVIEDTCMQLMCVNGDWNYIGQINRTCGECIVHGEPHIALYSSYNSNSDVKTYKGTGTYAISQPGFEEQPLFGVNSNFETCYVDYSCVKTATYFEPGIKVTMILPSLSLTDYCNNLTVTDPVTDPLCIIKVMVNNEERTIDKSVKSFSGTDGNVLVFKHNHISSSEDLNCINVVSSKGFSVSLCQYKHDYAWLYVWAMPSLHNEIYGLCDTFPGDDLEYTTRNETISNIYTVSADSWKIEENSLREATADITGDIVGRCTDATVASQINDQCNQTANVCPPHTKIFYDSCVYDLCRLSNPDRYLEGYASHVAVHRQISVSAPVCNCKFEKNYWTQGCIITEAAAHSKTACQCNLQADFPQYCWGWVERCKNESSPYCENPDTSYYSCEQGQGNCGGYMLSRN